MLCAKCGCIRCCLSRCSICEGKTKDKTARIKRSGDVRNRYRDREHSILFVIIIRVKREEGKTTYF